MSLDTGTSYSATSASVFATPIDLSITTKAHRIRDRISTSLGVDVKSLVVFDESIVAQGFHLVQRILCCHRSEAFDDTVFVCDYASLKPAG